MLRAAGAALALSGMAAPAAFAGKAAETITVTLPFGGVARTFLLHLPPNFVPGSNLPMVTVLAGGGGTGANMERLTGFDAIADANNFLVAYPNPAGKDWNLTPPNDDVQFLQTVVSFMVGRGDADPTREYMAGYSEGGRLGTLYACSAPPTGPLAGLGVVGSDLDAGTEATCANVPPLTYLTFHGTADPISPYNGGYGPDHLLEYSAQVTATFWQTVDGCNQATVADTTLPDELNTGVATTDIEQTISGCAGTTNVWFYTINGGGHTWPGSTTKIVSQPGQTGPISLDLPASQLMWNAFQGQTAY